MGYEAITVDEIAVGQPIRPAMVKAKNNFEYLYGQTGGPPKLPSNGSFEMDTDEDGIPDNWTRSLYPGGVGGLETATPAHGSSAAYFTHPGGAENGGGYLESDYMECSSVETYWLYFIHWATAAGMKNIVRIVYYTAAKAAISTEDVYSSTSNPTSATLFCDTFIPPATARFMKIQTIGGYTDTNVAGTAYFDGLWLIPAPYSGMILEAMYGASSVDQTALKTTTGVASTVTALTVTVPGGSYAFFPQIRISNNLYSAYLFPGAAVSYSVSYATLARLEPTGGTAYLQSRYIQSSPPYDFGDGHVMGFVYLALNNNGDVISSWIAPDPPWYGNGSNIQRTQQSRYLRTRNIEDFGKTEVAASQELTPMQRKMIGMDETPQPFVGQQSNNIVMLDPMDTDLTQRIVNEMLAGGDPVDIFRQGYAQVDNTQLRRQGPPNVAIHRARWRDTITRS